MSPKSKVRKKPAKHRNPQAAARQAALVARRKQSRTRLLVGAGVVLVVVTTIFGLSQVIDNGGDATELDTATPTTVAATSSSLPAPPAGATVTGDTPCPNADGSAARTTKFEKPPPICIVPTKSYVAEMQTSKGLVTITLDPQRAPYTVNNFVVLSRYHYFDGIPFHRIASGFVIQGGSPDGSPNGGPGYTFQDELPVATDAYKVGSVAMANSGANTNGSQFFIVVGPSASALPPNYSRFGEVTGGMDVVKAIEAAGSPESPTNPQGGQPTELVTIQSVTIKES